MYMNVGGWFVFRAQSFCVDVYVWVRVLCIDVSNYLKIFGYVYVKHICIYVIMFVWVGSIVLKEKL